MRSRVRRIEHSGYGIDDYDIVSTITFEPRFDAPVFEAKLALERHYDGHQTRWSYVFLPAA